MGATRNRSTVMIIDDLLKAGILKEPFTASEVIDEYKKNKEKEEVFREDTLEKAKKNEEKNKNGIENTISSELRTLTVFFREIGKRNGKAEYKLI